MNLAYIWYRNTILVSSSLVANDLVLGEGYSDDIQLFTDRT